MSSIASAPKRAAPWARRAAHAASALAGRATPNAAVGLLLATLLVVLAFLTRGGVDLPQNTWAEIALVLLGCGAALAGLVLRRPQPRWGAASVLLFAALAALSAISISWSVRPDSSWLEANRTLSYLAVFGIAALAARLRPDRWPAVPGAIAALATAIGLYALLTKALPGIFDAQDPIGRLRAPFDYVNAIGLIPAIGLPAAVWAGARRDRGRVLRGLAVPAIAILDTVLVLTYSRSALLAAVGALALWFTVAPLRLRGALILGLGSAGGGALAAWALHTHAITHDRVPLAARSDAGHGFGLVLVLVLPALVLAGLAAAFAMDSVAPAPHVRRRTGVVLLVLLGLVPLGGIAGLAASSRGLTGQISHAWSTLTDVHSGVGDAPGRLVELGNSRPRYWSEGLKVGEHSPLHGAGAGAYGTARTRYAKDPAQAEHAHSYVVQTFADLGAIGILISLALLVAWGLAVRRTLGPGQREGHADPAAERAGLLSILCVVVAFGVQSTIDWTWAIPGTAIPALVCAGWLAGRGPLSRPLARLAPRRRISAQPALGAAAAVIVAAGLLAAWAMWQPLRSANADGAAIGALSRGDAGTALRDGRAAVARNPLSAEPLWDLANILTAAGQLHAAHAELVKAVSVQPQNSATWRELGLYDLAHGQPHKALGVLRHAIGLYPADPVTGQALQQAQAQLRSEAAGA